MSCSFKDNVLYFEILKPPDFVNPFIFIILVAQKI